MTRFRIAACVLALAPLLGGCVAAQVVGAAVNTTGAVVGATARTTGAAVRAVIPDGESESGSRSDAGDYAQNGSYAPSAGSGGGYTRADAEADARGR